MDSDNLFFTATPYANGAVVIDATDDGSTVPAPIEFIRVEKPDV